MSQGLHAAVQWFEFAAAMSRVFVQEQNASISSQRLAFVDSPVQVASTAKKLVPKRKPVLATSQLMQHFPSQHTGKVLTGQWLQLVCVQ